MNRQSKLVLASVGVVFAVYLPLALWVKHSEPRLDGVPGQKVRLFGPFVRRDRAGFAYVARAATLDSLWDSVDFPERSPVIVYEDSHPLGPAHSMHADIEQIGRGRFSHWKNYGIIFSASDNTDPNNNGHAYWAVVPPSR